MITGPMPHDWIFPQTNVVVHHGGAGTTGAVMRSGVPGVVLPVSVDQYFWGRRTHRLQVGPQPIPFKKLTANRLAETLNGVIKNPAIRDNARQLGKKLQAEDGVGRAVKEIGQLYEERQAEMRMV